MPRSAGDVFGGRLGLAERYAVLLATSGVERGLIGPREVDRLWSRHLLNCAVVAELVPERSSVIDVGSGAGLPGLALAIARPDLDVVLVEPLLRRTTWLLDVIAELDLAVDVVRGRAEALHGSRSAAAVVSRAVAPLDRLTRWCLPLVEQGGVMLAIKGGSATREVAEHAAAARRSGATQIDVVHCGTAILDLPTTVVRVVHGAGRSSSGRIG